MILIIILLFSVLTTSLKSCKERLGQEVVILSEKQVKFFAEDPTSSYRLIVEGKNDQPSVLGEYEREGSYLIFTATFAFSPGQRYEIVRNDEDYLRFVPVNAANFSNSFTKVVKVLPEVDTVPENLLKMYIHFSQPIDATQSIYDHITVWDVDTKQVRDIFLPLENELWNTDRTEVTLWLDPGRIKKELIPHQEKGIPIKNTHSYHLLISDHLRDQNGNPVMGFQKQFTVVNRDAAKPDVFEWTLTIPQKQTQDPLKINFHEVLDAKLVLETIGIYNSNLEKLDGNFTVLSQGREVYFIPKSTWKKGHYTIRVESRLEDLAGNNLNRLFDVDLQEDSVSTDDFKERSFKI